MILSGERAMGRGDAELMLAGGLFLGVKGVVVGLFLGLILGCIFGLIHKAKTGDSRFAFGPYAILWSREPLARNLPSALAENGKIPVPTAADAWWIYWCWTAGMSV